MTVFFDFTLIRRNQLQTQHPAVKSDSCIVAGFLLTCLVIRLLLIRRLCRLFSRVRQVFGFLVVSLAWPWCLRLRLRLRLPAVGIVLLRGGFWF